MAFADALTEEDIAAAAENHGYKLHRSADGSLYAIQSTTTGRTSRKGGTGSDFCWTRDEVICRFVWGFEQA